MRKDHLFAWAIFALGGLAGAMASLVWRAPSAAFDACPKGFSGLWVCPQEWQATFATAGAITAAGIAFYAAKHTAELVRLREEEKRRREEISLCRALAAETNAIANALSRHIDLIRRLLQTVSARPRPLRAQFIFEDSRAATETLVANAYKIGLLPPHISICLVQLSVVMKRFKHSDERRQELKEMDDGISPIDLSLRAEVLKEPRDLAKHLTSLLLEHADALEAA